MKIRILLLCVACFMTNYADAFYRGVNERWKDEYEPLQRSYETDFIEMPVSPNKREQNLEDLIDVREPNTYQKLPRSYKNEFKDLITDGSQNAYGRSPISDVQNEDDLFVEKELNVLRSYPNVKRIKPHEK